MLKQLYNPACWSSASLCSTARLETRGQFVVETLVCQKLLDTAPAPRSWGELKIPWQWPPEVRESIPRLPTLQLVILYSANCNHRAIVGKTDLFWTWLMSIWAGLAFRHGKVSHNKMVQGRWHGCPRVTGLWSQDLWTEQVMRQCILQLSCTFYEINEYHEPRYYGTATTRCQASIQ